LGRFLEVGRWHADFHAALLSGERPGTRRPAEYERTTTLARWPTASQARPVPAREGVAGDANPGKAARRFGESRGPSPQYLKYRPREGRLQGWQSHRHASTNFRNASPSCERATTTAMTSPNTATMVTTTRRRRPSRESGVSSTGDLPSLARQVITTCYIVHLFKRRIQPDNRGHTRTTADKLSPPGVGLPPESHSGQLRVAGKESRSTAKDLCRIENCACLLTRRDASAGRGRTWGRQRRAGLH